jgi:hypothetical protein
MGNNGSQRQCDTFAGALQMSVMHLSSFDDIFDAARKCGMSIDATEKTWKQLSALIVKGEHVSNLAARQNLRFLLEKQEPLFRKRPSNVQGELFALENINFPESEKNRQEFHAGSGTINEANALAAEMDRIGTVITSSAYISPELRKALLAHVALVAWALRNPISANTKTIVRAFMPIVEDSKRTQQIGTKAESESIYNRIICALKKTLTLFNLADQNLKKLRDIDDDTGDLF